MSDYDDLSYLWEDPEDLWEDSHILPDSALMDPLSFNPDDNQMQQTHGHPSIVPNVDSSPCRQVQKPEDLIVDSTVSPDSVLMDALPFNPDDNQMQQAHGYSGSLRSGSSIIDLHHSPSAYPYENNQCQRA